MRRYSLVSFSLIWFCRALHLFFLSTKSNIDKFDMVVILQKKETKYYASLYWSQKKDFLLQKRINNLRK